MKRKENYNGLIYDVLEIDNSKLTRTQMKKEWKKFISDKEYSKVKTTYKRKDNFNIETTMFFKNGKLHNEFDAAVETLCVTDFSQEYYLDGKKIDFSTNNWNEFVINHKRSKILKETLEENEYSRK